MNDYWYHPYHNMIGYVSQIGLTWNVKDWYMEFEVPLHEGTENSCLGTSKRKAEKELRAHGWVLMDEI